MRFIEIKGLFMAALAPTKFDNIVEHGLLRLRD